jgi:Ca-activated chloride channel family protein
MKFLHPEFLYVLPLFWLLAVWAARTGRKRRLEQLAKFSGAGPANRESLGVCSSREKWDLWLGIAAGSFLLLTLARPVYFNSPQRGTQLGTTYLIALDASRSMLANDVRPSRYAAATNALDRFFSTAGGDRIGLITFSGVAYLNAPLTPDVNAIRTILGYVNPYAMSDPGSSLASVLDRANRCFSSNNVPQRTLVIITDGEDLDGTAPEVARKLHRQNGMTVHTIGVGTATGISIPALRSTTPGGPVPQIVTKLDESNLRRVANAGGGRYFRLGQDGEGLNELRTEVLQPLAEKAAREDWQNYRELFYLPLGLALLTLVAKLGVGADRHYRRNPLPSILKGRS